jgi:hypothetical protein
MKHPHPVRRERENFETVVGWDYPMTQSGARINCVLSHDAALLANGFSGAVVLASAFGEIHTPQIK